MLDTKYSPVYLLNSYIWQLLKNNTDMDESDYGGLIPIVPVSDVPEIQDYNKPYLIYGYAIDPTEQERHFCQRGSMSFAIYSTNFREVSELLTILQATFNREDLAAADVNEYTSTIPEFRGIRFGTIFIGFSQGPSPEVSEGGRESALINLRFEYYVDYDIKTNMTEWH